MIGIETYLRRSGDNRSWETIKEILKSHNMATVVIPGADGREYRVRKMTVPSEEQMEIYRAMGMRWAVE